MGFVSSYSLKLVTGTRQRFLAESQPRQCGLATLRMLATGWPPNCSGPGMPQRPMTSSRLDQRAGAPGATVSACSRSSPPTVAGGKLFVATYGDNEPLRDYGGNNRPTQFPRYGVAVYGAIVPPPRR